MGDSLLRLINDIVRELKKEGFTTLGIIVGFVALLFSGAWVVLIPVILLLCTYYIVKDMFPNKIMASIVSYYFTSVIMSSIGLLIHYFPNKIGGGLFESGYIIADFMTLNSIIDWIVKIQTDSWGIVYNWVIVSTIPVFITLYFLKNKFFRV